MNLYTESLRALIAQEVHKLSEIGDQWRTPEWLFWAVNDLYGPLVVDLFTDGQNSKCPVYFTAEDNALRQDWGKAIERAGANCRLCGGEGVIGDGTNKHPCACRQYAAFANPPYSIKRAQKSRSSEHVTGMTHIMRKAYEEHCNGVRSVWVVKSATSETWWPHATVSKIIHITGRIGFDLPFWYEPDIHEKDPSGAGFGASILIFNGEDRLQEKEEYVSREHLMSIGIPIAQSMEAERARWVARFDGL